MQDLIKQLANGRQNPRLWFESLVLFSEANHEHIIRTIRFHRGLNLVWAKEPTAGSAIGVRAAGHGVGKSSLCLLLRYCLGDSAKSVIELREELLSEFPLGGVGAILHVDNQPFTLFRFFNSHKDGVAIQGKDIDALWHENTDDKAQSFGSFLQHLTITMMDTVSPRIIPDTGQDIEWRHVLAWISRDQGSRFKSFFSWREGEGTGLQRSRQDPPIVMRAVLGLLEQAESDLMNQLADLEKKLENSIKATEALLHEPVLIRRRIESNLRAWRNLPDSLSMHADDLFADSVVRQVQSAAEEAQSTLLKLNIQQDEIEQELADVRVELKHLQSQYVKADLEFQLADAARQRNESAYRSISEKLQKVIPLGNCKEGNIEFSKCQHIQNEIQRLQVSQFKDGRDKLSFDHAMTNSAAQAGIAFQNKQNLNLELQNLRRKEVPLISKRDSIRIFRDRTSNEANKGQDLLLELERWEKSAGSEGAQVKINESKAKTEQIKGDIGRTQTQLTILQDRRSERVKRLGDIMDRITTVLLPQDAFGTFNPMDESRPFHLSMRGGEAYRVLEVLLGDIACLIESAIGNSAFPGFIVHDCPREADMSTGLYENFLLLIKCLQKEYTGTANAPFQYIVTTTTPPPLALLNDECLCLELDPSSDSGLLFKRRFGGERQNSFSENSSE